MVSSAGLADRLVPMPELETLVFNFIPVDPAKAGGIATVCQMMAEKMPAFFPDAKTLVLTGGHSWESDFPLQGNFQRLDFDRKSSRLAGVGLEQTLTGKSSFLAQLQHRTARSLKHPAPFPPTISASTLVHVPYQILHPIPPVHWRLAYVMNLHDLQHEHFPEFFDAKELDRRRERYLASAKAAQAVVVVDEWTRRDVLAHLDIPEDKVYVGPFGPTWGEPKAFTAEDEASLRARYGLPEKFMFYPAQTWPHKNYFRLFQAMRELKATQGLELHLVSSGHQNEHFPVIQSQAKEMGLENQVHFLGLIPGEDVPRLYLTARMTVIPSLFEGGSGIPVQEAMALGSPLAASTSCGIPDCVGDAALLFDPLDVAVMAQAIARLWTDEGLRRDLADKGRARASTSSWEKAGRTYAEIYREALRRWNLGLH